MKTPHKHAELIKAWADGAEIEVYLDDEWRYTTSPSWANDHKYRIKPKPAPDTCSYFLVKTESIHTSSSQHEHNLILHFDGETGEFKSAEVV